MCMNRSSTVPAPVKTETNFEMILLEQYCIQLCKTFYIHDLIFELVLPIAILWDDLTWEIIL